MNFAQFVFSSIFYPMHVVSTCMIVSGSKLHNGAPLFMPNYKSWTHCWTHLNATNSLKRGSSIILRYYNSKGGNKNAQDVPLPEINRNY